MRSDERVRQAVRTAAGEAFVLPLIFLTVALAGGFRVSPAGGLLFVSPPLFALVLATFLFLLVIRTGVLAPERLLSARRGPLENANGGAVLFSLYVAAVQTFNCVTPEAGFPGFFVNVLLIALLWNTAAVRPAPPQVLRGLMVMFGAAFILKYIVLAAVYSPESGLLKRILLGALDSATLGALRYEAYAPATGYVAFFTVALFLVGLFLLPGRRRMRHHAARLGPAEPAEGALDGRLVEEDSAGWRRLGP
jgi:hypothetical protein